MLLFLKVLKYKFDTMVKLYKIEYGLATFLWPGLSNFIQEMGLLDI